MAGKDKLRLVVVDDDERFVEALRVLLAGAERMVVVGTANDGGEAVDVVSELQPDVVLMDYDMPIVDGAEATRRILAALPETCVIVVSASEASGVKAAEDAGAVGFVPKSRAFEDLLPAIDRLCR